MPAITDTYIQSFNAQLTRLGSSASVARTTLTHANDVIELLDDEGQFVTLIPSTASPEMTVTAIRLYAQGLNKGLRAGERLAWAKLRHLVGAASAGNSE